MSNGREADMSEPMSVEIPLDDRQTSRKSSTSTSSFEDLNTLRLAKGRRQSGQSYNSSRSLEPATVQVEVVPARKESGASISSSPAFKKSSNIEEPSASTVSPKASKTKGKGSKKDSPKKVKAAKVKEKKEKPVKQKRDIMNEDRDPGNVNGIVKIKFEEIFAEPEGAYSFGTIWGATYKIFSDSKVWCYKFLSALCGVPCALCWGLHFACLSFCQIWCNQPSIRSFSIQVKPLQKVYQVLVDSFVEPCFEAFGRLFSNIKVQNTTYSAKEV